ncbi:MAG: hypothetical protein KAJ37_09115, partial [Candidatus Krumholzibacteria bacterium]|nr:hypothetical protein [Candidatus Krumholzibacteria bacterium]
SHEPHDSIYSLWGDLFDDVILHDRDKAPLPKPAAGSTDRWRLSRTGVREGLHSLTQRKLPTYNQV